DDRHDADQDGEEGGGGAPERRPPVRLPAAGERGRSAAVDGRDAHLAAVPGRRLRPGQPPLVRASDQRSRARRAPGPDRGPRGRGDAAMIPSAPPVPILASLDWLATYLVHSTLLLGGAWLVQRRLVGRHPLAEEAIWRTAFFGAILTATLQVSTGWHPLAGALALPQGVLGNRAEAASIAAVSQPPEAAPAEVFSPAGVRFVPYQPSREFPAQAIVPAAAAPVATASLLSTASLVRIWLLAAAALLLRLAISHWALRRRIRVRLEVVGGTMFQILRRLRAESGVLVSVCFSCVYRLATPIAFGLGTGLTQAEIAVPPR